MAHSTLNPSDVFKILSVDTRLKIIELLRSRGPLGVKTIAEELGVTPSAISQHLRVLRHAGFVDHERQGYWVPYSLDEHALGSCCGMLMDVCTCECQDIHHPGAPKGDRIQALRQYKRALKQRIAEVEEQIASLLADGEGE